MKIALMMPSTTIWGPNACVPPPPRRLWTKPRATAAERVRAWRRKQQRRKGGGSDPSKRCQVKMALPAPLTGDLGVVRVLPGGREGLDRAEGASGGVPPGLDSVVGAVEALPGEDGVPSASTATWGSARRTRRRSRAPSRPPGRRRGATAPTNDIVQLRCQPTAGGRVKPRRSDPPYERTRPVSGECSDCTCLTLHPMPLLSRGARMALAVAEAPGGQRRCRVSRVTATAIPTQRFTGADLLTRESLSG